MLNGTRPAKVNVRFVVLLTVAVVAIGFSFFAAREAHRAVTSKRNFDAGLAAYEQKDWLNAAQGFQKYLRYNPDDMDILRKYAEARISIRPLEAPSVGAAIAAYRRIIQLDPIDTAAYKKLAELYIGIENYEELAHIARTSLKQSPADPNTQLWLAQASIALRKNAEARQVLESLIKQLDELPVKPEQYVQACSLMSQILSDPASGGTASDSLQWLNRAADACPLSVEALATRAQFYRLRTDIPNLSEEERLNLARKDLNAADALGVKNPRLCLFLGSEWLELGELDRVDARLKAADEIPQEVILEYFFDLHEWTIGKFILTSQLAIRRKDTAQCIEISDKILTQLEERNYRVRVLPSVVMLNLVAGKVTQAKQYLDEYLTARSAQEESDRSRLGLIYLQALVARADEKPYVVINTLQPAVLMDTSRPELWQLMAEAYIQTDQTRRAISSLIKYLSIRPSDKAVTQQLAQEYLKLRDWTRALETARLAESMDTTDILIRLLRIEVSIYRAAERSVKADLSGLEPLAEELKQLRKDHPDRVDIRILQAIVADNLQKPDEAEAELKLAIAECKDTLEAEMQLVRHYYRSNRITEAVDTCRKACERNPNAAEPWLSLSNLYVTMTDYKSAKNTLEHGIKSVSGKIVLRSLEIQKALLELMYLDRQTGIELLSGIAQQNPQEIRARILLLNIREVQRDKSTADRLIKELQGAEGENGLYWRLYQAALWLSADDWRSRQSDIVNAAKQCINSDPEWSDPVILLAGMYQKMGDLVNMELTCRQALSRNPSATDVADVLISLLENQGRFSDAEKILAQVETNSQMTSAWNIRIALNSGDFSRAIEELKLRVSNDEKDANSRILLARLLYWQTHDAQQAFAILKEVEAIAPSSIALSAARVAILRAEGRTDEAIKILDTYVSESQAFSAYAMRAAYLANTGQLEAAEKDYLKLITFKENGIEGYELLTNFYAANKKVDEAIKTLEDGLKAYPEELSLKRALIKALLTRNSNQDQQKAIEMLADLKEKLPSDPELIKIEAMYILQNPTPANIRTASQKLEQVVKLEPTAVDAHLALIGIAMQQERYQDARDSAILALGANPNNTAFLSARARAELELKNDVQIALELVWQILQREPGNTEAMTIAINGNNPGFLEKVQALMESASLANPMDLDILISISRIYVSRGQPEKAISKLLSFCQTDTGKSNISALITLADLYRMTGDMELAKKFIEQAAQIDPKSLTVIHSRFLLLMAGRKYDELSQISSMYLSAEKPNSATLAAAASALMALDSAELRKEAVKLFEHAVKLSPASKVAQIGLASILYQEGDAARAVTIYQELLKQYPADIQVVNNLAWILQEHDKSYDEALKLADKGLAIEPNDIYLLDTRGTILANMENHLEDARKDYEKLVDLTPSDSQLKANALLRLGRICIKLKDVAMARQYLKVALDIDQKINVFTADERSEIAKILQTSENRASM
ncbi:MAG: tetratricopeptide repeat protein [Sedimentisphaerales bacterium]|nr:tetratricopeptide repeat protein [Sedimentisphaerales bacterium]